MFSASVPSTFYSGYVVRSFTLLGTSARYLCGVFQPSRPAKANGQMCILRMEVSARS